MKAKNKIFSILSIFIFFIFIFSSSLVAADLTPSEPLSTFDKVLNFFGANIIPITGASHLDSSRNFISDIYDSVKAQDGNWSEAINNDEYVRVIFERNLTSKNDITVYARNKSADAKVEIYTKDGTEKIAEIKINGEGWYKTYLTNLVGSSDTFDLKSFGDIEYDYVVDPAYCVATGGTITTYINGSGTNMTVHTFKSNGTFNVTAGCSVDYLVVGGGGGGGGNRAGGGGGAGAVNRGNTTVSAGNNYTIIIGKGGTRSQGNPDVFGTNGGNSSFDTIIAQGGGLGGMYNYQKGYAGGCGGGGAGGSKLGGASTNVTPEEGYAGGNGAKVQSAGGGGGAGGKGSNAINVTIYGVGGIGIVSSINGSDVTYATGGDGYGLGPAGAANTGNGGAGTGPSGTSGSDGKNGGSGIVIIRYITPSGVTDNEYPTFSNYSDNNASLIGSGIGYFNVTIENTNGTVWLEINNTNVTAFNSTANVYNVSYNFTNSGTYNYKWWAYGNGTLTNLNNSGLRYYTVNSSVQNTCTPPATNNNWNVLWSDNCVISENVNLGTGKLYLSGSTGTFTLNANITLKGKYLDCSSAPCKFIQNNIGRLIYG